MAGGVIVRVVGTAFEVRRVGADVAVVVHRGLVRVTWADGQDHLAAGQQGRYPVADVAPVRPFARSPDPTDPTEAAQAPASDDQVDAEVATSPPRRRSRSSWRRYAKRGDYARAFAALERSGAGVVRDRVDDLMLAADAARFSGHDRAALPYLARVVSRHRDDPRAAAFTEGRLRLRSLGEPAEAARAFATARRLDPGSSLAQDAPAREVECYHVVGDTARARRAALEYVRAYPRRRRVNAVRKLGGLEWSAASRSSP